MEQKVVWKFLSIFIVFILIAVFILSYFVSIRLHDDYENSISARLQSNAVLIGDILKNDLEQRNTVNIQEKTKTLANRLGVRITIISINGEVWGDSENDPAEMENHGERLEVKRALEHGMGESDRFSDTMTYNMKYIARAVQGAQGPIGFVRLAMPLIEVQSQVRVIYRTVLGAGLVVIILVIIFGYIISRNIASPINQMQEIARNIARGDFSQRVHIKSNDELGALARSLNKMADELERQMNDLKKVDKLKTDFVANVSHELKTPLTSIKGFIETLEDGALEDKEAAKKFVGIIKKQAERLNNIIDDLLALSELEEEHIIFEKSSVNMNKLIEEVLLGFQHACGQKKHSLEFESTAEELICKIDKFKIEQALVNLIDNAIKYTPEGGRIKVTLSEDDGMTTIQVEDSGIGIPEKYINRICERFYRVDKTRSRQSGGTGLGLAIVKHIALLHNGKVRIDSIVNKGTTAIISFPTAL